MLDCSLLTENGITDLRHISPLDMTASSLSQTLAKINRYSGRTPEPWSVAAHSVLVSRLVSPAARGAALLHDAHEAFLGDIITPAVDFIASQSMPVGSQIIRNSIQQAKQDIDRQIEILWGVTFDTLKEEIREADKTALHAEMFAFFGATPPDAALEQVERALEIIQGLPQGGEWRSAALAWETEARQLAAHGVLRLPPQAMWRG